MELIKKEDIFPVCPFCKTALTQVHYRELQGVMGKRYVYFCSGCSSVLGVSHRKGFWMG